MMMENSNNAGAYTSGIKVSNRQFFPIGQTVTLFVFLQLKCTRYVEPKVNIAIEKVVHRFCHECSFG